MAECGSLLNSRSFITVHRFESYTLRQVYGNEWYYSKVAERLGDGLQIHSMQV